MQSNAPFLHRRKRRLGDRSPSGSFFDSNNRSHFHGSPPIPSFSFDRLPSQRLPLSHSSEPTYCHSFKVSSHLRRHNFLSASVALRSPSATSPQIASPRMSPRHQAVSSPTLDKQNRLRQPTPRQFRRARIRRARSLRHPKPLRRLGTAGLKAIAWIVLALLLRWFLEAVMVVTSQFWLLGTLLAIAPAVTAVWLTQTSPRTGLKIGYRCLLVMVGLLLGGKVGGL